MSGDRHGSCETIWIFVGDIGHAIEKHAKKNGFSVVRDLCGHGVGIEFHEEPDVEHFREKRNWYAIGAGNGFYH